MNISPIQNASSFAPEHPNTPSQRGLKSRVHDQLRDQVVEAFVRSAAERGAHIESAVGTRLGEGSNAIRPDALITLHHSGLTSSFFIEVDRSTERLEILVQKCRRYAHLRATGGFARHYGLPRSAVEYRPFRVLFYVKSAARAANIAAAVAQKYPHVRSLVWFTCEPPQKDPFHIEWIPLISYASADPLAPSMAEKLEPDCRGTGKRPK